MVKIKNLVFFVAVFCVLLQLGACGKVSAPEPFEESGYPHSYPRR